eukprot:Nk52_evm53s266 gene=Nk52_evmTU53s266
MTLNSSQSSGGGGAAEGGGNDAVAFTLLECAERLMGQEVPDVSKAMQALEYGIKSKPTQRIEARLRIYVAEIAWLHCPVFSEEECASPPGASSNVKYVRSHLEKAVQMVEGKNCNVSEAPGMHEMYLRAVDLLGKVYVMEGRAQYAVGVIEKAVKVLKEYLGKHNPCVVETGSTSVTRFTPRVGLVGNFMLEAANIKVFRLDKSSDAYAGLEEGMKWLEERLKVQRKNKGSQEGAKAGGDSQDAGPEEDLLPSIVIVGLSLMHLLLRNECYDSSSATDFAARSVSVQEYLKVMRRAEAYTFKGAPLILYLIMLTALFSILQGKINSSEKYIKHMRDQLKKIEDFEMSNGVAADSGLDDLYAINLLPQKLIYCEASLLTATHHLLQGNLTNVEELIARAGESLEEFQTSLTNGKAASEVVCGPFQREQTAKGGLLGRKNEGGKGNCTWSMSDEFSIIENSQIANMLHYACHEHRFFSNIISGNIKSRDNVEGALFSLTDAGVLLSEKSGDFRTVMSKRSIDMLQGILFAACGKASKAIICLEEALECRRAHMRGKSSSAPSSSSRDPTEIFITLNLIVLLSQVCASYRDSRDEGSKTKGGQLMEHLKQDNEAKGGAPLVSEDEALAKIEQLLKSIEGIFEDEPKDEANGKKKGVMFGTSGLRVCAQYVRGLVYMQQRNFSLAKKCFSNAIKQAATLKLVPLIYKSLIHLSLLFLKKSGISADIEKFVAPAKKHLADSPDCRFQIMLSAICEDLARECNDTNKENEQKAKFSRLLGSLNENVNSARKLL